MNISKQHSKWKRHVALWSCLGLGFLVATDALAQRSGTTRSRSSGGRTGFGGGGFGGASGARDYPSAGMIGDAMIQADPETRRLVVITDDETSQYISQVITNLDRPKPQVLIKVVFLEVTYNDSSDIGIEGSLRRNINNSTSGSVSNLFGLATAGMGGNAPGEPVGQGLYQILGQDYQVALRAIQQAGKKEVLSRPSILTRNNQPATILVGQSVPLVTNTRYDTVGGLINTVSYRDVGIILRVTPFITSDNMVEMIIQPEISAISSQTVNISAGVQNPVIDTRSADTVVVTPDGQTVIIGGLMETQKKSTENKIPLLGDIPLLGNLFKRKAKGDVKTELMIFLTPHIVREPSQLAGVSGIKPQLAPKAFTEQELDKFLERIPAKDAAAPADKNAKPKRK